MGGVRQERDWPTVLVGGRWVQAALQLKAVVAVWGLHSCPGAVVVQQAVALVGLPTVPLTVVHVCVAGLRAHIDRGTAVMLSAVCVLCFDCCPAGRLTRPLRTNRTAQQQHRHHQPTSSSSAGGSGLTRPPCSKTGSSSSGSSVGRRRRRSGVVVAAGAGAPAGGAVGCRTMLSTPTSILCMN